MKKNAINYNLNEYDLTPLPKDEKLERMVLGLLIDLPNLHESAGRILSLGGIFYSPIYSAIYEAMQKVISFKMVPNKENVEGYFTRLGDRETAVTVSALSIYAGEVTMFKQYCLKLFEIGVLRTIIRVGHDMNIRGYQREDALKLLADASNGIGKLYEAIAGMKSKTLADGVSELTSELAAIASSPDGMLGIKGSIPALNHIIKGYRKGNMIVIGASSGEGKTTLMLQEVNHFINNNIPVGVISLEMTQSELLLKMACEILSIAVDKALDGKLTDQENKLMGQTLDRIAKMPLHISETPALKIGEIKATARMWKNRSKIKVLCIDHMHLANSDFQHGNAEQKFTDIANQIKELAKELDIPVISLAQLARKEADEKRMHRMTDLKYAGGIEQAADVIIMVFRPEHHGIETTSDGGSTAGKAIIKVEKLRLLRPGFVKCEFDGLRFTEENTFQHRHELPKSFKSLKEVVEEDPF